MFSASLTGFLVHGHVGNIKYLTNARLLLTYLITLTHLLHTFINVLINETHYERTEMELWVEDQKKKCIPLKESHCICILLCIFNTFQNFRHKTK